MQLQLLVTIEVLSVMTTAQHTMQLCSDSLFCLPDVARRDSSVHCNYTVAGASSALWCSHTGSFLCCMHAREGILSGSGSGPRFCAKNAMVIQRLLIRHLHIEYCSELYKSRELWNDKCCAMMRHQTSAACVVKQEARQEVCQRHL